MAEKIGFVGLGIMGKPMVRNLMAAGYELTVYDIVGEPVEELATEGASASSSPREATVNNVRTITMLPDSADSERAILGPDGVLEGAAPGSVIIDMSSIAPSMSQKIGVACADKGVEFLDAPVSGGEPGAIAGALAIMVGGKQSVFDDCEPLLQVMGGNVVLTGDIGAGNITKLANQIIVAANIEALSEALVLTQKAGVDPERVFNAIRGGLAGERRDGSQSSDDAGPQFQGGFPCAAAPEGPSKRAANSGRTERTTAGHCAGTTDVGFADQRRRPGI